MIEAFKNPGVSGLMYTLLKGSGKILQTTAIGLSLPFSVGNVTRDFGGTDYNIGGYLIPRKWVNRIGLDRVIHAARWIETFKGLVVDDANIQKSYMDALWNRALANTLSFEIAHSMGQGAGQTMEVPGFRRPRGPLAAIGNKLLAGMTAAGQYTEVAGKLTSWRLLEEQVKRQVKRPPEDPKKLIPREPEFRAHAVSTLAGTPPGNIRGTIGAEGNLIVMFLNVAMRNFQRSWERTMLDPKRSMVRALVTGTALATTVVGWNASVTQSEDPNSPEWDKIPLDTKRDYWIFLSHKTNPENGRREFIKISKPEWVKGIYNAIEGTIWELARKFKPGWAERDAQVHRNDRAQMALDVATELLNPPGFNVDIEHPVRSAVTGFGAKLNPGLKVPIEQLTNLQAHTRTPILTSSDLRVAAPEQYDSRTSPSMVIAAQSVGISPKRLEHVIRGFGAAFAESLISLADLGARKYSPQPLPARHQGENIPIISGVVRRVWSYGYRDAEREQRLEDFYNRKGLVDQALATYKRVKSQDKVRAQSYLNDASFAQLRHENIYLTAEGEKINEIYHKLRAAPTEAEALGLNVKLSRLLEKIERGLARRDLLRRAAKLKPPGLGAVPTGGPPGWETVEEEEAP
jgi:hypothetical protein